MRRVAGELGIGQWLAGQSPVQKVALVEALRREGRRVVLVGDRLKHGPSFAAASVSASPASAADVSQTVADVVFQGRRLAPVLAVLRAARRARAVMRQNIFFQHRLQFADAAPRGRGIRHPVAGCGGDVEFVADRDGQQFSREIGKKMTAMFALIMLEPGHLLGGGGLAVFLWALRSGHSMTTLDGGAASRILYDDCADK